MRLSTEFWKYVPGGGGINACPEGLQIKPTFVQGRCNQIDACIVRGVL